MKNLSRHLLIDILFSTRGQSEAQTADTILAALSQQQEADTDERKLSHLGRLASELWNWEKAQPPAAQPQHAVVMCDCHLHETQVCDICQGVDGTEVDATPINYRAHAEALAEASTLAIEYWEHRMQRYKNRHPVWVVEMRAALAAFEQDKGKA